MSRVFKIRVWDAEENRWFYTVPGQPDDHNVLATWHFDEVESHGDRHIWEQYTDLKDKNGKEIYEGDILREEDDGLLGVVEYDIKHGAWWVTGYSVWLSDFGKIVGSKWRIMAKVIGNVHENPELLEGAK